MKDKILEVNNLSLPYAFKDLNMSFYQNEFITISGPNSCGKTTLIKTLAGQLKTDSVFLLSKAIEEYKQSELSKLITSIVPEEINFRFNTLEEELENISITNYHNDEDKTKDIFKKLNINKLKKQLLVNLAIQDKIKVKLALSLIKEIKILLLDDIFVEFNHKDKMIILSLLKEFQQNHDITIIMTTSNLEETLESNYLYIINNNIELEGSPLDVLQKDNIINKLGLDLPFIVDLSVKLRDYDLISNIELSSERLVDKLWN